MSTSILYQADPIGQKLDRKAAADADLLTDAAKGWELMRMLDARRQAAQTEKASKAVCL